MNSLKRKNDRILKGELLRYTNDTTFKTESKELTSLLMKVKEESATFRKLRSWHLVPSFHGK